MTEKDEAARVALSAGGRDGSATSRLTKEISAKKPARARVAVSSAGAAGAMIFSAPEVSEPAFASPAVGGSSQRRVESRGRPTPRPAAGKVEQQFDKLIRQFKRAFAR